MANLHLLRHKMWLLHRISFFFTGHQGMVSTGGESQASVQSGMDASSGESQLLIFFH